MISFAPAGKQNVVHQALSDTTEARQKPDCQVSIHSACQNAHVFYTCVLCSIAEMLAPQSWLARPEAMHYCCMQIMVLEALTLAPSQQVDREPLGSFSKAAALHMGLDPVTAASSPHEQLQRKLHALQQQLDIARNKANEARAEAKHYRSLYHNVMSNLQ